MEIAGLSIGEIIAIIGTIGSLLGFYTWVKVSFAKIELRIAELQEEKTELKCEVEKNKDEFNSNISLLHKKLDKVLFFLMEKK